MTHDLGRAACGVARSWRASQAWDGWGEERDWETISVRCDGDARQSGSVAGGRSAAEELGCSSLLMPDVTQMPSPVTALAVAAGATTTLRLGTWVLAAPLRPARLG